MYYLVKGKVNDEILGLKSNDEIEMEEGSFEYVLEADSVEQVKAQLEEYEIPEEIREISVEERIDREEKELFAAVKRDYLMRRYGNRSAREYLQAKKQINTDPEMYYKALVDYNKTHRLTNFLKRKNKFGEITMSEYFDLVNQLTDAQTEEEFNKIINSLD